MTKPWERKWRVEGEKPWERGYKASDEDFRLQPASREELGAGTGKLGFGVGTGGIGLGEQVIVGDDLKAKVPLTRRERAEKRGIDPEAGGGFRARMAAEAGTQEDVQRALAEQFGVDPGEIEVANVENVGLVYKNPETGQMSLLDEAGLDPEDFTTALAEAPVIAAEVIGGLLGIPGGPAGIVAGSAAGAGAGRFGQQAVLKGEGIISDVSLSDVLQESALAAVGATLPVAGGKIARALSPQQRALREIEEAGVTADALKAGRESLSELQDEGAEFAASERLQAAGEIEIAESVKGVESALEDVQTGVQRRKSQRLAREQIEQRITPEEQVPVEGIGTEIVDLARQNVERRQERILAGVDKQVADIKNELAQFSGTGKLQAGEKIRGVLREGRDKVFKQLGEGYDNVWSQVPESTKAQVRGIRSVAKRLDKSLKEDILPSLAPEDKNIVSDLLGAEDVEIGSLNRAISLLKNERRVLERYPEFSKFKRKDLVNDVIRSMEKAREKTLGTIDPALAGELRKLDQAYSRASQEIDESLVGDILLKKSRSNYVVPDDKVLQKFVSSPASLRDYLSATAEYPQINAVSDLKQAVYGKYNDEVIEGGSTHATWMRRNKDVVNQLFSPKERQRFATANRLQDAIRVAQRKEGTLLSDLRRTFDYQLSNFYPEEVINKVEGVPEAARRLKSMLSGHPDKWKSYQAARGQRIAENLDGATSAQLDNMLKGDSRSELLVTMGPNYVKDLDKLRNLMRAGEVGTGKGFVPPVQEPPDNAFGFVRNMVFGPLTRVGFRTKSGIRFLRAKDAVQVKKLLADPDLLEQALRLRNAKPTDKKYQQLLSAVGVNTAALGMSDDDL